MRTEPPSSLRPGEAVAAGRGATPAAGLVRAIADRGRRGGWVVAVPSAFAFCLGLWSATTLSYDRDEIVTVSMARRSLGQILHTVRHYDIVHAAYYVVAHYVALVFGTSELVMRMPAILGTAVAAGATAALGRRLISPLAGLAAGLIYPVLPVVAQYSHIARQYTIVPAVGAVATLLLLRALERSTRRSYLAYAVSVAVLGVLHIFALLVVVAHLLAVLLTPARRRQVVPLLVACGVAAIPVIPILVLSESQQYLVAWIKQPGFHQLQDLAYRFGGGSLVPVLVVSVLVVFGAFVLTAAGPVDVRALLVGWLLAPTLILFVVSQVHPVYQVRYVLVSAPAVALLAAAGAVRLPWRSGPVAVVVVLALMIPQNLHLRHATSSQDQLKEAARYMHAHAAPGDAVLFMPAGRRPVEDAYPAYFAGIRDIARAKTPAASATLGGSEIPESALAARLGPLGRPLERRVWLIAFSGWVRCTWVKPGLSAMNQAKARLLSTEFSPAECERYTGVTIRLYTRP